MLSINNRIAEELGVRPQQVAAAVALLDEGSTVPFIARYRKEVTGSLDDTQLRNLEERLRYLRELDDRRASILASIDEQGKLTPELTREINLADTKIDMLSASGHKLHAPKGIGVLYLRRGVRFRPLLRGGQQERGRRAGTENAPSIIGLGVAALGNAARIAVEGEARLVEQGIGLADHLHHLAEVVAEGADRLGLRHEAGAHLRDQRGGVLQRVDHLVRRRDVG